MFGILFILAVYRCFCKCVCVVCICVLLCVCLCVYTYIHMCMSLWKSENNERIHSFLYLPCVSWGLRLGHQVWWLKPFSFEPTFWLPWKAFLITLKISYKHKVCKYFWFYFVVKWDHSLYIICTQLWYW